MAEALTTTRDAPRQPAWLGHLLAGGWQFDFYQAVWLLERYTGGAAVGDRGPVAQERLRFRPAVSMGFPAADVQRVQEVCPPAGPPLYRLDVRFMGLYGVATPLPLHYAVEILRSVDHGGTAGPQAAGLQPTPVPAEDGSSAQRDFLDILNHRVISLLYRAWTKYRYHVTFGMPQRDRISDYLAWLAGLAPQWDESQIGVQPRRLLRYVGCLTQHPKSAIGLEGLLQDYWKDIPLQIEQFVGRWVTLRPADLNRIGAVNCRLGEDLTVGEQVYDVSSAFSVAAGPVDWETYKSFLPDGPRYAQTRALVRLYLADPLAASLRVRLRAAQVPPLQMTSGPQSARLGYTSWVRTGEMGETDVTFSLN